MSRLEVYLEQYVLSVGVEARTTVEMAKTVVYPAAMRYQGQLAATAAGLQAVGGKVDTTVLDKVSALIARLEAGDAVVAHDVGGADKLAIALLVAPPEGIRGPRLRLECVGRALAQVVARPGNDAVGVAGNSASNKYTKKR